MEEKARQLQILEDGNVLHPEYDIGECVIFVPMGELCEVFNYFPNFGYDKKDHPLYVGLFSLEKHDMGAREPLPHRYHAQLDEVVRSDEPELLAIRKAAWKERYVREKGKS